MTKYIISLIILSQLTFYACGNNYQYVVKIDGSSIKTSTFYSFVNRKKFDESPSAERRKIIMEFSTDWLAEKEAKNMGLNLDPRARHELLTVRNQQIIESIINQHIRPSALDDSTIDAVWKAASIEHSVSEIIIYHALSKGSYAKRSPNDANKQARIVMDRLNSKSISFLEAVSIYTTITANKINEGSIGFLKYGNYPKSYNDAIWYKPVGSIIGPIKTEFGYHIVKLGSSRPVKNQINKDKIKRAISTGSYGVLKERMDLFSLQLRSNYRSRLDTISIIELWNKIEDKEGYKNKKFSDLSNLSHEKPLGVLDDLSLNLSWFIEQSYKHGQIYNAPIIVSHALLLNISDILNRELAVRWARDNNIFDFNRWESRLIVHEWNLLKNEYIKSIIKSDPSLTEAVILNRLLNDHIIEINEEFISQ